jgi:hypothetical protein
MKKKKLEAEHINKVYSAEDLTKSNELDIRLDKLQEEHAVCRIDCELRNRHRVSDEEQHRIDQTLRKELEELDESDDDGIDGGNKRQSRRRRRGRGRRSFRNKTNQKHSRRQKRSNRIRSNTRRHRK